MSNTKPRCTVRLSPNQELVLKELSETLNVSISMLIRTIIGSWLTTNEDHVYRLIDRKKFEKDAVHKQDAEETEDLFGQD
jgi:hypothetical protein